MTLTNDKLDRLVQLGLITHYELEDDVCNQYLTIWIGDESIKIHAITTSFEGDKGLVIE